MEHYSLILMSRQTILVLYGLTIELSATVHPCYGFGIYKVVYNCPRLYCVYCCEGIWTLSQGAVVSSEVLCGMTRFFLFILSCLAQTLCKLSMKPKRVSSRYQCGGKLSIISRLLNKELVDDLVREWTVSLLRGSSLVRGPALIFVGTSTAENTA